MTQPLASMTGYARATGTAAGCSFTCEIRSVNARGLDIRTRLATGLDAIDSALRTRISKRLARGSVSVNVGLQREGAGAEVAINEAALAAVLEAVQTLSKRIEAEPPRLDGLLALPGVMEARDRPLAPEVEETLDESVLSCIDRALDDLVAARRAEGVRLAEILSGHIDEIERLAAKAEAHPARGREAIQARLAEQVAELMASGNGLSEERLHQEAMLLATKADIREEIDRLKAHVAAARELIAKGGPVGRRLDFLSQEFNREANTLCAKSNAVDLTAIGLDLKAVIDQLREQIQNVE